MTTGHMFMAMSLDGFVAREDFGLDWLMKQKTEGEDHGNEAFMESVNGLVMGSGSLVSFKVETTAFRRSDLSAILVCQLVLKVASHGISLR